MRKKRSIGVTVFAYLNIVLGILGVLALLTSSGVIIFTAPLVIVGLGLFKLKEWARKLEIFFVIFDYLSKWAIIVIISKNYQIGVWYLYQTEHIISLIAVIITIYFFTRPKVKEQFQ